MLVIHIIVFITAYAYIDLVPIYYPSHPPNTHTHIHHSGCLSFKIPADNGNSCPVIPWTSVHSLTTEPPSNWAKSLGSNKESIVVGSVGILILLSIIISVIFVSIFKYRDQKMSAGSIYNYGMSYRQLLHNSDSHQTNTSEQEWTTYHSPETSGSPGVLMDCAPPSYHTIVTLTQPVVDGYNGTVSDTLSYFNSEYPPPYPTLSS